MDEGDDSDPFNYSNEIKVAKKPAFRQLFKIKNPWKAMRERQSMKKLEYEERLLRREEKMKQDLERYQMEIEEKDTWAAYELRERKKSKLIQKEAESKLVKSKGESDEQKGFIGEDEEIGLSFYQGIVTSYKRWQNSPAKHRDFRGHTGPVVSCKLSKCMNYVLSCSVDKKLMLWSLQSGKSVYTFVGHTKRINDCDIHPSFDMISKTPCLKSCSGDLTIRTWCPDNEKHYSVIRGHERKLSIDAHSLRMGIGLCRAQKTALCGSGASLKDSFFTLFECISPL